MITRARIHMCADSVAHAQTHSHGSGWVCVDAVQFQARINGLVMLLQKVAYVSSLHTHTHITVIPGSARSGPSIRVRVQFCSVSE